MKALKEHLRSCVMAGCPHQLGDVVGRLEALEEIREYAGAPKTEKWLKAEEKYLKAVHP